MFVVIAINPDASCHTLANCGIENDVLRWTCPPIRALYITFSDSSVPKRRVFVALAFNPDASCHTLMHGGGQTDVFWWVRPSIQALFATLYEPQLTNMPCFFGSHITEYPFGTKKHRKNHLGTTRGQSERYLLHFSDMS